MKRINQPLMKRGLVSGCEATHWSNANALHTLFESEVLSVGGDNNGYIETISCKRAAVIPVEYQIIGANDGTDSLFLRSATKASSFW